LLDRIPIIGWFGLRREASIHGSLFWVRPMLIELSGGLGFSVLYWWEIQQAGLMPMAVSPPFDPWMLHAQYTGHVILISLMIVATFIDFDEKTIPDAITVPGTLVGLLLMALWPAAAPPVAELSGPMLSVGHLQLKSPLEWPQRLDGTQGLWIGMACFVAWCFAIWPKTVTMRRGPVKAVQFFFVSMIRYPVWWVIVLIMLAGCAGIAVIWNYGGAGWTSLLTSLVGMAFGGGLIWVVRIVGGGALGKEAMGFGDVTLMAMIGAYLGWQASLMIFVLAPFVAIFICLIQWALTRRRDIAFGPYLCAASLIMIVRWSPIWEGHAKGLFGLGWMPQLLFFCLILLAGMLRLWRITERLFFEEPSFEREQEETEDEVDGESVV
jgi:prepilin signal peptidase PulO-like enzyme (type II secretory pathway)